MNAGVPLRGRRARNLSGALRALFRSQLEKFLFKPEGNHRVAVRSGVLFSPPLLEARTRGRRAAPQRYLPGSESCSRRPPPGRRLLAGRACESQPDKKNYVGAAPLKLLLQLYIIISYPGEPLSLAHWPR